MSRRTAGSTGSSSISPTRSSAIVTAIAGPTGGFCVWLNTSELGGDVAVTLKLFKEAGVRVVPGSYLARLQPDGFNPGAGYIRLALVQDSETTARGAAPAGRNSGLVAGPMSMSAIERVIPLVGHLPPSIREALARRMRELDRLRPDRIVRRRRRPR